MPRREVGACGSAMFSRSAQHGVRCGNYFAGANTTFQSFFMLISVQPMA